MRKLDVNRTRSNGTRWYMEDRFTDAELVTAHASNRALGIKQIRLFEHGSKDANVFGSMQVEFSNGLSLKGSLFNTHDGQGIHIQWRQEKANDGKYYPYNIANVPLAITAQILRYAETCASDGVYVQQQVPVANQQYVQQPANVPVVNTQPQQPYAVEQAVNTYQQQPNQQQPVQQNVQAQQQFPPAQAGTSVADALNAIR